MTLETVRLRLGRGGNEVGNEVGNGVGNEDRGCADAPGGTVPVSVAAPASAVSPRGGVIVIPDARGITNYVLSVCEQLCAEGWLALTPHLYHRDGLTEVPVAEGSSKMLTLTAAGIAADVDACLEHLATVGLPPSRAAIIGFCMGGTAAFLTSVRHRLGAAVSFYGGAVSTPYWTGAPPLLDVADQLRTPWLGLYGENDTWVTLDEIRSLRAAAARAPVPTELISYPGAQHAFHTPERPSTHDPVAARDAWARMLRWLETHVATT
ncbi:dienelactone hydrolase family protein [Frankia sp. Mgl5]|uniref:dienelactone hydrolase family protein n=1 Tax=Frankia sp. Mgl5 TaxID=2933793 RepID=UPI00200C06D0|nr:dienelactone hydrolase family protein [Frankia sp. Mgl5]MCK9928977.1 dienelactone hydrolase family protein [Frankia sp. Mgl5]